MLFSAWELGENHLSISFGNIGIFRNIMETEYRQCSVEIYFLARNLLIILVRRHILVYNPQLIGSKNICIVFTLVKKLVYILLQLFSFP